MRAPLIIASLLISTSALAAQDFERQIAPLLARRCLECHSGPQPKGKLDLTTRAGLLKGGRGGPAVIPGASKASELWTRVAAGEMPPKKPLPDAEKKLLQAWIEQGAIWRGGALDLFARTTEQRAGFDWWSLQPVRRPELPKVNDAAWPHNPIDQFILERLQANNLKPSPEADPGTLLRRLSFDLLGLPPAPEEVEAFLKDCAEAQSTEYSAPSAPKPPAKRQAAAQAKGAAYSVPSAPKPPAKRQAAAQAKSAEYSVLGTHVPDAVWSKWVERLLASPRYGERWARHWLDSVRFAESHGFEHDELRVHSWPYRDWVIDALNRDLPYDEFVRMQIAGDVLRPDDPGAVAATGFMVAGGYDSVGQRQQSAAMKAVVRQDELEDMVGTLGQTFLGLTVHCARCHDHKFDPIRQTEYYRITAALAGVRHGERVVEDEQARVARQVNNKRLVQRKSELTRLENAVRAQIVAERQKLAAIELPQPEPKPLAHWDFTLALADRAGKLHARIQGDADRTPDGLVLRGKGYAVTPALGVDLKARTLACWVKLSTLDQAGGAALTLEVSDGSVFDAIVFGEREPRHWLAGSDFFRRSLPFQGPEETAAHQHPIHLALVYRDDGTILAYRGGAPYGKPIKPGPVATYRAGEARILFGLRHSPAGGNRRLQGTILQAEVHDRALTPDEVAALAQLARFSVSEEELARRLAPTDKKRRERLSAEIAQLTKLLERSPPKIYAVMPSTPEPTFLLARGEPSRKEAELTPGGLQALGDSDFGLTTNASDAERRRKLAAWLTAADNPLLGRVMVNRLWHHHFGAGLVETPSDFGFSGGRPSHPELLDWLAAEFRESGWSLKHVHRLIVTSATYRQASGFRREAAKIDAGNRLLWRKSPMRLEAEAVRDAVLAVSGKLNPVMGGPGYQDFKVTIRGATYLYEPHPTDEPAQLRRSIYRTWARSGRNPFLDALDCPDPSTQTPRRAVTTTPLQALTLLNNDFMLTMAGHAARRVGQVSNLPDVDAQIARAYQLALGRALTQGETAAARRVAQAHGLAAVWRALFNCNEFLYVD